MYLQELFYNRDEVHATPPSCLLSYHEIYLWNKNNLCYLINNDDIGHLSNIAKIVVRDFRIVIRSHKSYKIRFYRSTFQQSFYPFSFFYASDDKKTFFAFFP